MPAITLNATSFAGTVFDADSVLRAPTQMPKLEIDKIGPVLVAENGARTFIRFGQKARWAITWKRVPDATRAAVKAVFDLTSTFVFVDSGGTSHTVQCEPGDYTEECDTGATLPTSPPTYYYDVTLVVREP